MAGRVSEVESASEFPAFYKLLSRRLYEVLEDIGVSTAVRDVKVKCCRTEEIVYTATHSMDTENEMSCYMCGSGYEGTATAGMRSDFDILVIVDYFPVVLETQQYMLPFYLLLLQDCYTPAGYVKLKWAYSDLPEYRSLLSDHPYSATDTEGRVVFNIPFSAFSYSYSKRHGPARSTPETENDIAKDIVLAVRCRTWPACALEWLTRQRHHNWPTQDQLDICKTLGCFFVQVGHPTSAERHLQWRLSFTLQERMLVTDFNSVQLKCYVLLKMMNKKIIRKLIGEESLTSYHFKTCVLYMIENTPADIWTVDYMYVCLHKCLSLMLVYAEKGVCPNYFIPGENMFDGRIFGQLQTKLCEALRQILSADFKYLLEIDFDELGHRYYKALLSESFVSDFPSSRANEMCQRYILASSSVLFHSRNTILETSQIKSAEDLFLLKIRLHTTERVTDHTVEETHEALSLLIPCVDISLMSALVVEAKRLSKSNELIFNLLTSDRWNAMSLESDSFSAKLKQACLLHVLGYYEMSLDVLLALDYQVALKTSGCKCSLEVNYSCRDVVGALSDIEPSSLKGALQRYWIPCIIFLPIERDLVPFALCYEMDRSVGSPPGGKKSWYDWAVVDGKILFYFLLCLNHRQLGMEAYAAADTDNIRWIIRTDRFLGHKETAYNLLGWLYKETGDYDQAVGCFQESLALKNSHNAAFLHLQEIGIV